ncbi:hypothetical protein [Glaciimonas immobilis]|uniref:hypothetical protein n=1 Tax=Glaciimonas immobilis TaxID=728004 RepID=UPI00161C85B2|nr:hypothetical protein [Glaciimonas immobilis]
MALGLSVLASVAQAQTNATRATIEAPGNATAVDCQHLRDRINELDKLEQQRLLDRGTPFENKRPAESQDWINQQRKETQTKMFFGKC